LIPAVREAPSFLPLGRFEQQFQAGNMIRVAEEQGLTVIVALDDAHWAEKGSDPFFATAG
jgi:hypothetical protein